MEISQSGKMSRILAEDIILYPHMYDQKSVVQAVEYQKKFGTPKQPKIQHRNRRIK